MTTKMKNILRSKLRRNTWVPEWYGCITPVEYLFLYRRGFRERSLEPSKYYPFIPEHLTDKGKVAKILDRIRQGDMRPNWFYFSVFPEDPLNF